MLRIALLRAAAGPIELGPVGSSAGASEVIVIDMIADRLRAASDFGPTECIAASGLSSQVPEGNTAFESASAGSAPRGALIP